MKDLSKQLKKIASDLEAMLQEKELKRMDAWGDAPKATKLVDRILGLSDAKAASKLALEHFEKLTREERERVFEHIADLSDLYKKEADVRGRDNYWAREMSESSDESDESFDPNDGEEERVDYMSSVEYESSDYGDDEDVELGPKVKALIDSGVVKLVGRDLVLPEVNKESLKKLFEAIRADA